MQPQPLVVDLSHDDNPDFGTLKDAGVVGVILKASQGSTYLDPSYQEFRCRAAEVFGKQFVHAYHFLDGSSPSQQIEHFINATPGIAFRWLDYEWNPQSQCDEGTVVLAFQSLGKLQSGKWPGIYGSDLLNALIDDGHFGGVPRWLARYGAQPAHSCVLWQYAAGEDSGPSGTICGGKFDVSCFVKPDRSLGSAEECAEWFRSVSMV